MLGEPLSERERRVLLAYANGMREVTAARVLLLTVNQVQYSARQIYAKLGVTGKTRHSSMTAAVAIAWRRGLIEAHEIHSGGSSRAEVDAEEALLDYAALRRSPPPESWLQLRLRCRLIANEVRANRAHVTDHRRLHRA